MSSAQKTAHTAGPWKAVDTEVRWCPREGGPSVLVARVAGTTDESMANAFLIAAAPDLMAALQLLHKWFDITGSSIRARWDRIPDLDRKAIVDATRAAIAKAEGR